MSLFARQKQTLLALLGIPLLCTTIVFIMISAADHLFQDWENKTLDYRFKLRGHIPHSPEIALIDIDDKSIAALGRWPWGRKIHADMIDILSESGASVIGYDILFNQITNEAEDRALESAIKKAGNVYLPTGLELTPASDASPMLSAKREIGPLSRFRHAAAGIGHISSHRDADGTIRRVPLLVQHGDAPFPAFAVSLLQGYFQSAQSAKFLATPEIQLQNKTNETLHIPVDEAGRMTINYAGPWVSTFSHYPFADIWQAWQNPEDRSALRTAFAGKIVLVSNTATGYDLKPVPFESDYPGGGIHANILNTVITGQYLREPGAASTFAISLFLSIIISTVLVYKKGQVTLPVGLAVGLCYLALSYLVFVWGIVLPVLFPILTITVTSLSSLLYQKNRSVDALRKTRDEKDKVSKEFQAVRGQLEAAERELEFKKAALAQMVCADLDTKQTHTEQIEKLCEELEKSEKIKAKLEHRRQSLELRIKAQSPAKPDKKPPLQADLETLKDEARTYGLITSNPALLGSFLELKKVAKSRLSVLIVGETGTGKELIAEIIHKMDERMKDMTVVNTPTIPDTLFDQTLYGHEKGAFTGADRKKPGKFHEANESTLFLDEIGEIPSHLQTKLLRAVETGQVDRVGATRPDHVKVRVVSATNRQLEQDMQSQHFRSDLFFRLGRVIIKIPPLRERKEDIDALAAYFIERSRKEHGTKEKQLSEDALEHAKAYNWPGNVRELKNKIEKACISIGDAELISAADLGLHHIQRSNGAPPPQSTSGSAPDFDEGSAGKDLSDTEFLRLLKRHDYHIQNTATAMGLKRSLPVGQRFRGICLKTLHEHQRDVQQAAKALSEAGEDLGKLKEFISAYYDNLVESVKGFENSGEAVEKCKKLFKNVKTKYHKAMFELVKQTFKDNAGKI